MFFNWLIDHAAPAVVNSWTNRRKHDSRSTRPRDEEQPLRRRSRPKRSTSSEGRAWYVIHTYSGYENKVKTNLEHRIASMDAGDLIHRVVVPTVDEIEVHGGVRRTVSRKIFPGYVLVADDHAERERPGVEPRLVRRAQHARRHRLRRLRRAARRRWRRPRCKRILRQMKAEEPRVRVGFVEGQSVRIVDGPFVDFVGVVDEINLEKGKVKVMVSFFGRETPVELDFLQVERL